MKKNIAILFVIIYASTVFGEVVNFHYCGKYLAKVSLLNLGVTGGCACSTGNKPIDCCKNKLIYQKVDIHKAVQTVHSIDLTCLYIAPTPKPSDNFPAPEYRYNLILNNHLRRCCPEPIYLLNRVLRI